MYIDPASGGMLFQILAVVFGVLSGAVLMFAGRIKMGIAKMRRSLRRDKGENLDDSEQKPNSK